MTATVKQAAPERAREPAVAQDSGRVQEQVQEWEWEWAESAREWEPVWERGSAQVVGTALAQDQTSGAPAARRSP